MARIGDLDGRPAMPALRLQARLGEGVQPIADDPTSLDCKKHFSVKSVSVMKDSKLSLVKWVIAIYMISTKLHGVSSMRLRRTLSVTEKTA